MSVTNDEFIEELLWKAHEKGLGMEVMNRANEHIKNGMRKSFAYQQAYDDLQVDYH